MAKKKKTSNRSVNRHNLLIIFLILLVCGLTVGLILEQHPDLLIKQKAKSKELFTSIVSIKDSVFQKKQQSEKTPLKETKENRPIKQQQIKESQLPPEKLEQKKDIQNRVAYSFNQDHPYDLSTCPSLDTPAPLTDRPEQIIEHKGYTVSYNNKWKISNWVSYELTREETKGEEKRTNKFVADPLIKGTSATDADYRGSGYDRGHLAPAADMAWSNTAMKESFYFSNMTPQAPNLNRGIWKTLEEKVRRWADRDSAIIIVCGPVMNDTSRTIGKNRVLVPAQFYKVILSPYCKEPKAIGFLFDNAGSLKTLDSFAVSVDSIETLTGIDFFPNLPDAIESRIEGSFNPRQWF